MFIALSILVIGLLFAWYFWRQKRRERHLETVFEVYYVSLKKAEREGEEALSIEKGIFKNCLKYYRLEDQETRVLEECEKRYRAMKQLVEEIEKGKWQAPRNRNDIKRV